MRHDLYPLVGSLDGTELVLIAKAGKTRTTTVAALLAQASLLLPVYADNAAATAAGLVVGRSYRTPSGAVMVRV